MSWSGRTTKTDGVASVMLARYDALLKLKAWVPSPQEARVVRAANVQGPGRVRAVVYMVAVMGTRYNSHVNVFMNACLPEASPRCSPLMSQCAS